MNQTTQKQIDFYIGLGNETQESLGDKSTILQHRLAREFGGYSIQIVRSGWMDNGVLVQEDSYRVIVVGMEVSYTTIKEVGEWVRDLFTQKTVMVSIQFVQVSFV